MVFYFINPKTASNLPKGASPVLIFLNVLTYDSPQLPVQSPAFPFSSPFNMRQHFFSHSSDFMKYATYWLTRLILPILPFQNSYRCGLLELQKTYNFTFNLQRPRLRELKRCIYLLGTRLKTKSLVSASYSGALSTIVGCLILLHGRGHIMARYGKIHLNRYSLPLVIACLILVKMTKKNAGFRVRQIESRHPPIKQKELLQALLFFIQYVKLYIRKMLAGCAKI